MGTKGPDVGMRPENRGPKSDKPFQRGRSQADKECSVGCEAGFFSKPLRLLHGNSPQART